MEPKEDKPSVAQLRSLLNRTTRIKITDGRLFIGQFMCVDHSKNIILSAAHEYRTTAKSSNSTLDSIDGESYNNSNDSSTTGAGEDIPLKTLSTNAQQGTVPNVLAIGQSRKKEEEGKSSATIAVYNSIRRKIDCSHIRGADSRIKAPTKIYGLDYLRG
ncbi:hypothetical protein BGZ47_001809 [Haplosporangium gracile]|nr:hypothetical protein BGZ47_001809 [Haplosporangium gracile]